MIKKHKMALIIICLLILDFDGYKPETIFPIVLLNRKKSELHM